MLVPLVDWQAGPERRAEGGCAHLAHAAAYAGHRLIRDDRQPLLIPALETDLSQRLVEAERLAGWDHDVIQVSCRRVDVMLALLRGAGERTRALTDCFVDAERGKVVGRDGRFRHGHRQRDAALFRERGGQQRLRCPLGVQDMPIDARLCHDESAVPGQLAIPRFLVDLHAQVTDIRGDLRLVDCHRAGSRGGVHFHGSPVGQGLPGYRQRLVQVCERELG